MQLSNDYAKLNRVAGTYDSCNIYQPCIHTAMYTIRSNAMASRIMRIDCRYQPSASARRRQNSPLNAKQLDENRACIVYCTTKVEYSAIVRQRSWGDQLIGGNRNIDDCDFTIIIISTDHRKVIKACKATRKRKQKSNPHFDYNENSSNYRRFIWAIQRINIYVDKSTGANIREGKINERGEIVRAAIRAQQRSCASRNI